MAALTRTIIEAAIGGFEQQKQAIDAQIAELRGMLNCDASAATKAAESRASNGRRKFSVAARRRMKEAQQRRWAKVRGEAPDAEKRVASEKKPKRKLSKGGRAAIVAALKKRWAAKKTAAKKVA